MKRHKISVLKEILLPGGETGTPTSVDLDLPDNFTFTMQKSVEELNEANKIKRQAALGFPLPMTPTNDAVLERYRTPAIIDNTFEPITAEVWAGHVKLDFERLEIKSTNDKTGEYEAEITDADKHWIELAADTKLRDLDLGDFEFTLANVEANQENNYDWDAGNTLVWLPLLDMGNGGGLFKVTRVDPATGNGRLVIPDHQLDVGATIELEFFTDGTPPNGLVSGQMYVFGVLDADQIAPVGLTITTEGNGTHFVRTNNWKQHELRPLISIPGLLKTGFQQIGFELTGEIFETDWCKRKWQYILAPDYYDNDSNKDYALVSVEKDTNESIGLGTVIDFETIIQDESGAWVADSEYTNNTDLKIQVQVSLSLIFENTDTDDVTFTIAIVAIGDPAEHSLEITIPASSTDTIEFTQTVGLSAGNHIEVKVIAVPISGISVDCLAGSTALFELVEFKGLLPDSTFEIAELIHPDYTLLDAFAGFIHLGDFKLKTNLETKAVTVYPSETSDVHSEEVEGFWQPVYDPKDMSAQIEPRSRQIQMRDRNFARYVLLKFKDASDSFIKEVLKTADSSPLHSRLLDLGSSYKPGEPLKIENPFYEPTAEHRAGGVMVPALWDNTNYQPSFNIKPRIFHAVGYVRQEFDEGDVIVDGDPTDINRSHYFFEGTENDFLPYASQLPGVEVWDGATQYMPDENVVYGSEAIDLFTMFWDKGRFIRATLPEYSFLVRLSLEEYMAENFRQRWFIHYAGEGFIYRLQRMYNHNTGNEASTEAILIPEPNSTT